MNLAYAVVLSIAFGLLGAGLVLLAAGAKEWWDDRGRR